MKQEGNVLLPGAWDWNEKCWRRGSNGGLRTKREALCHWMKDVCGPTEAEVEARGQRIRDEVCFVFQRMIWVIVLFLSKCKSSSFIGTRDIWVRRHFVFLWEYNHSQEVTNSSEVNLRLPGNTSSNKKWWRSFILVGRVSYVTCTLCCSFRRQSKWRSELLPMDKLWDHPHKATRKIVVTAFFGRNKDSEYSQVISFCFCFF